MAATDSAVAQWVGEDKRRMLHVVYRVGDMQVISGLEDGGLEDGGWEMGVVRQLWGEGRC